MIVYYNQKNNSVIVISRDLPKTLTTHTDCLEENIQCKINGIKVGKRKVTLLWLFTLLIILLIASCYFPYKVIMKGKVCKIWRKRADNVCQVDHVRLVLMEKAQTISYIKSYKKG